MKNPESLSNKNEGKEEKQFDASRDRKMGEVAINADETGLTGALGGEAIKKGPRAVDTVHDHFPEDISPKEHFERDSGPSPLKTEEDFKEMFSLFAQEKLTAVPTEPHVYAFSSEIRPFKETSYAYLEKTRDAIDILSGEKGELPKTDVAIYLDKSARPVSWFVNELWDRRTGGKSKPQTEHLAIDREYWFDRFGIKTESGQYIDGNLGKWSDLPIHDVKQEKIMELNQLLKEGVVTPEELDSIIKGNVTLGNRIKGRAIDAAIRERGYTTDDEFELRKKEGKEKVKILEYKEELKNTYDAYMIAVKLRGLFVPGGLSEEDLKHPERIMDYPVGMEGKNITIVDEVVRSGTTEEVAKHFIRWAFPEAASVNFYAFDEAERLNDNESKQHGQMLRIPFWYSLKHDDGTGRGINDRDDVFYERRYKEHPNNVTRAAAFGAEFLGVPMVYEKEEGQKSLKLRKQIARFRCEYEKGHF